MIKSFDEFVNEAILSAEYILDDDEHYSNACKVINTAIQKNEYDDKVTSLNDDNRYEYDTITRIENGQLVRKGIDPDPTKKLILFYIAYDKENGIPGRKMSKDEVMQRFEERREKIENAAKELGYSKIKVFNPNSKNTIKLYLLK